MSTQSLSTETCVHCISCHLSAAQWRSQLQNCQAAKERLKCTSAKPFLKDWTNHLNPPLEPVSKLKHVNSNKKDVLGTVMEGAQEDGKLGAKATQDTGHTALKKASNRCQRAGGVCPVQPGNNVTFPASALARGRLPPSSSGHLNPERSQKPAQETVTAAALQVGNDHSLHSLNVGLQDRLVCNKENLGPQASTSSELIRTIHSNKNSLRKERVLAHRQGKSGTSRSVLGQKGSMGNHQDKEETDLDKFRKALPESRRSVGRHPGFLSHQFSWLKEESKEKQQALVKLLSAVVTVISLSLDRKQLEEWLASKGKTYKRPPMMLLQKQAVKASCRKVKAAEKQENPEQRCQAKINNIFTECLKLIEEGVHAEEISAVLSLVPRAEKFAKFWICQAMLLARSGPFDVLQLYREAVSAGAEPVEELRQTALKILKDAGQKLEGEKAEEPIPWEPTTPCPAERQPIASTPGLVGRPMTSLPPSVKLQVTSASRGKEFLEGLELKFVTPVRRSLRTERAQSRYPEMLKDHDPVVSSLSEILDAEEDTRFFFRKNKALPEVAELEGLSPYPPKSS
ncbi:cytoskeleton-associated protein 2-like [Onychostruthus taczanowskii]|uniref:cytoskeleton-associated protein 2-like n=1 Tax=Onychostruthus taczanowskii TaxID=356909 RepID=UPI001B8070DF|nr:cytoskeleton-associated protein 2-like [Onychostruthus taczanowskii]